MGPKSSQKAFPETIRACRSPLRIQGVFRDPLGSHFSRFRPPLRLLGEPSGSLWGDLFETFLLPGRPRTRKWMPFRMICFRMFFYTSFYGFRGRPGRQNHGFRMGEVAKITLSPEFDFSSFWLPFGFRFGGENAPKSCSASF